MNYFRKHWLDTNYIKFALCVNEDLLERTNKVAEGFNNYLSHIIEIYKPRMSYFVEKIKIITKKYFNQMIEVITGHNISENKKENCYLDIYNFLFKYHSNYKCNLFFKNLLQLENDFEEKYTIITNKSYLSFFSKDIGEEFLEINIIMKN